MASRMTIRFVEGLGYVGAAMIGLAGLTKEPLLRYFLVAGVVFCIIAVVRLLVINALAQAERRAEEAAEVQRKARRRELREEETQ